MIDISTAALPAAVADYFARTTGGDPQDPVELFAATATVTDEGHTYQGREAIATWMSKTGGEFTFTVTPVKTEHDAMTTTVVNRLEGNFPGGIVDLRYRFTLTPSQDAIQDLLIAP
ncbi:hypothetical protein ABIB25_005358 [Nakamurella sp. UYEF19]|uniref:nuclear transport factor 2 family protein n=1 Tax=Nakamurella sp. UYEF19 TaxID=1756392 RepID=UPI0033911C61